jgi:hypothetical protein
MRLLTLIKQIVLIVLSANAVAIAAEHHTFRAGAATSDITPKLGLPIVGNWDSPPATSIHDKLHVRCLVLDDGETKLAFAICDNVGIPREVFDMARKLIASQSSMPPENVLMAATHTHSGVSARNTRYINGDAVLDNYQTLVARRIAESVSDAVKNLQPAKIGRGSVDEPSEVHNRRWYVSDPELLSNPFGGVDKVRMNPPAGSSLLVQPAGPVDPEVSFISVQTTDGKPIALLANYSLHYVGGVPMGEVSADYFAAFAEKIGTKIGADESFIGILSNGTSGDVNNIQFTGKRSQREPYEQISRVAELIASRVAEAHQSLEFHDTAKLASANEELTLKMRKPDAAMTEYFASRESMPEKKRHQHEVAYAGRVKSLADGPDTVTILLQSFRIGDLAVAAIPFEVFAETGLDLKKRSPFSDTFTIELASGSYGYLPTPAQHKLGGYETWMGTNRVQLDASDRITEVLLRLLNKLNER